MSIAKRWTLIPVALAVVAAAALPSAGAAQLGGFVDKLKKSAEQRADRAQHEAADKVVDQGEQAVRCAAGDQRCVDEAKKKGKKVVVTDATGKPAAGDPQASGTGSVEAASAQRVGEGAWANYDFVPGARVLFAEDYAKDRVGNFPRRLEFTSGNMEVVDWKGRRFLRVTSEKSKFAIPLPEKLPARFTVEMDVTVPAWGVKLYGTSGGWEHPYVELSTDRAGFHQARDQGGAVVDLRELYRINGDALVGKLVRLRIAGDGRYVKVYVDEHRVANVPNADFPRTGKLYVEANGYPPPGHGLEIPTLIGPITVAAGGPEMYEALVADGRVVTQGILFDTGSDAIRPESTPTLKEIEAMLQEHADLRLEIDGHTDAVGQPASNQALSEKRADAVRRWLVGNGVDAKRLRAKGFGQTRPAAGNDSPEGRQNNRRVELVKL